MGKLLVYYRGMQEELPETFWAWLAGFIDGDGCIGCYSGKARVTIAQKDLAPLQYILWMLGYGSIASIKGQDLYAAAFGPAASRELCRRVLPYLRTKKRQKAEKILGWQPIDIHDTARAPHKHPKYGQVVELYQSGIGSTEITRRLGITEATVLNWISHAGLKARTLSEAQKLRRAREKSA